LDRNHGPVRGRTRANENPRGSDAPTECAAEEIRETGGGSECSGGKCDGGSDRCAGHLSGDCGNVYACADCPAAAHSPTERNSRGVRVAYPKRAPNAWPHPETDFVPGLLCFARFNGSADRSARPAGCPTAYRHARSQTRCASAYSHGRGPADCSCDAPERDSPVFAAHAAFAVNQSGSGTFCGCSTDQAA